MNTGKIIALSAVGIILLVIIFIIAKNLTTTESSTGGGSSSTSVGGIGKAILAWFTGKP